MQSLDYTEAVVFVTRQYHWLVQPLISIVDKYLGVPLTFLSDRPIDVPEGHRVIECFHRDCMLYGEPCGKEVKAGLEQIEKPLLLFFFADFLLQKEVDFDKLRILELFMLGNDNVARGNLWDGPQESIKAQELLKEYSDFKIMKLDPNEPGIGQIGATSLMPAMWNKNFILDFMGDDWQLDHIELPGQHKFLEQSHWYSIGTYPGLFQIAHLCYTSDLEMARLTQMKDEDRMLVIPHIPPHFRIEL